MDISIDDILADLDRDTTIVEQSDPSSHIPLTSDGNTTMVNSSFDPGQIPPTKALQDDITPEKDYIRLMTLWRNERCSPELLRFPTLLMKRMLRRVQEQIENIENISMGFYQDESASGSSNDKLPLLCMEAELERVKFLIRSYLRCRMHKIDKYMLYLKQLEYSDNTTSLKDLLSAQELIYHNRHFSSLLKLFNSSVLRHMPTELQAINDTEGSISMVDEPEWGKFVFLHVKIPSARALKEDPLLERNEFGKPCYIVTIQELNEDVELTVGGIYVMRYEVIRDLLRDGKVELI
ncbi:hypothetical protein HG537_0D02550 [Torulaspora globosa]|uniref:DNA replication complex GINS protein SLD5 n=1 Tax=Torulaspora globosa TaxID=48254 RepID=A0A7H9HR76_9SACH|nr:hypothetical protein HG537_0D02550 [Torulaspora sp. CBS 2947]